jgi:hypothetical protein
VSVPMNLSGQFVTATSSWRNTSESGSGVLVSNPTTSRVGLSTIAPLSAPGLTTAPGLVT